MKSKTNNPPTLIVRARMMLKKIKYTVTFFNGYAMCEYSRPVIAQETYKKMKESGLPVEIQGSTIKDNFPNKDKWEIFEKYLDDVKKAQTKNGKLFHVEYELV